MKFAMAIAPNKETNSIYCFVITTENQSFKITKHAINSAIMLINKVVRSGFKGLLILASKMKPVSTVSTTHIVE